MKEIEVKGGCPSNKYEVNGCPVDNNKNNKEQFNSSTSDLVFGNDIHPDQQIPLSKKRTISNIPKGEYTPDHQPPGMSHWVYPSQQQYYNAMKRKGYSPDEKDVEVILAIHNIVNEKGWSQVKEWEELKGCTSPKLVRFMGRPTDISPKAYLKTLLGYTRPFDRHDWVVLSNNGEEVRYVIDFYTGEEKATVHPNQPKSPISMHLDVRPALDSPSALLWRVQYNAYKLFDKYLPLLGSFSFKNPFNPKSITTSPTKTNPTDETKEKS